MTIKLKKIEVILCFAVFALAFVIGSIGVKAFNISRWTTYGDRYNMTVDVATEEDAMVVMQLANQSLATTTLLIDKSDVKNFPHIANAPIHITKVTVDWNAASIDNGDNVISANATSSVIRLGVVASTTGAGAVSDVYYFDTFSFDAVNGPVQRIERNYYPSGVKLDLNGATTTGFLTDIKDTNASKWATTTKKYTAKGGFGKEDARAYTGVGIGDLVFNLYSQFGAATTTITVYYRVKY